MPDMRGEVRKALALERKRLSWRADPVAWVTERVGGFLWSKQKEIMRSVQEHPVTLVQACHGPGKSYTAANEVGWWVDTRDPVTTTVVSTAPSAQQVHSILWEEIRRLHGKAHLEGEVNQNDRWRIGNLTPAFGRKPPDDAETAFQGIHNRDVLVVVDEASGVKKTLWTGVKAITTGPNCRILAIGNPDDPTSEFHDMCLRGEGNIIKISAFDCPAFTGEFVPDNVKQKLISRDWVEARRKEWGENSPLWISKVLGEWPNTRSNSLLSIEHLNEALKRWDQWRQASEGMPVVLGVDVARFGGDRSVIAARRGPCVGIVFAQAGMDTMSFCGVIKRFYEDMNASVVQIDGVGVGAGVVDRLAEMGVPVIDLQSASESKIDSKNFANARADWWFQFRHSLHNSQMALSVDKDGIEELSKVGYSFMSNSKIKIQDKESLRKDLGRSPDLADALIYAWATPEALALPPSSTTKLW